MYLQVLSFQVMYSSTIDKHENMHKGSTLFLSDWRAPVRLFVGLTPPWHVPDKDMTQHFLAPSKEDGQHLDSVSSVFDSKIEVTTSLGRFLWDPKCSANHGVSWVMMGPFRSALRLLAKRPYGTGWVSTLRFMRTAGCAHFAWPLAAWIKDLRQPHAPSSYTQVEFIDFFPETDFLSRNLQILCRCQWILLFFFLFLGCLIWATCVRLPGLFQEAHCCTGLVPKLVVMSQSHMTQGSQEQPHWHRLCTKGFLNAPAEMGSGMGKIR